MRFPRYLYLTVLTASLSAVWGGSAAADTPTNPIKNPIVIDLPPRNTGDFGARPKAPSMQSVTCTYNDGFLTFEFAFPEGECELMLSDLSTGDMVIEYFDSAVTEPVYVGYHSTASLTVTTENGNTYTGEW